MTHPSTPRTSAHAIACGVYGALIPDGGAIATARALIERQGNRSLAERALDRAETTAAECCASGQDRTPVEVLAVFAKHYTAQPSAEDRYLGMIFLAALALALEIEPDAEAIARAETLLAEARG